MIHRMMKGFSGVIMCFLISAAQAEDLFDQANAYYTEGQFEEAVQAYETILQKNGPQIGVLQNLGSAYYSLGDNARAILSFERALLLKPSDADLLANLKLAQDEATVFPAEKEESRQTFLEYFSSQKWSELGLVSAFLLPVLAVVWVLSSRKNRWISMALAGCSLVILGVSMYALSLRGNDVKRGIVLEASTEVKVSPFAQSEARSTLTAGREVRLGKAEGEYLWVTGEVEGWVHKASLARVIPQE